MTTLEWDYLYTFGKGKVTLHLSHLTWMSDNTPQCHLAWTWGDYFGMRCYFGGVQTSNDEDFQKFYWWLVRGALLMELWLLCDFLGNFFRVRCKTLFLHGEGTRSGHEMTMATWGENAHARWHLSGGGDNSTHNVRWMWHENGHTKWEWSCEVTIVWWRGQLNTQHEVGARWEWPCKVRMVTWGEIYKVILCPCGTTLPPHMAFRKSPRMDMRWIVTWGTSHLVKFFTPWYLQYVIIWNSMLWYEWIHENVQTSITMMKNLKIFNFKFWKIEFHYTFQVKHPFLWFEVKNNCLNHLFL